MTALDRSAAELATDRLKAFAQPQRLMILSALVDRELAVGAIDVVTGIGQPALSQKLAELRRAKLVAQRREAKQVLYRLADERTTAIVRFVGVVFGGDGEPATTLVPPEQKAAPPEPLRSAAMFAIVERGG